MQTAPDRYLEEAVIAKRTQDGTYTLFFGKTGLFDGKLFGDKHWEVYKGSHPQLIDWTQLVAKTTEDTLLIPEKAPKKSALVFRSHLSQR